jgi:ATP-dependent Zn protease
MLLVNVVMSGIRDGETIQYSQFKILLNEGRVETVTLTTDAVRGTYQTNDKTTAKFTAVRIEDPKLLELLDAKGVRYEPSATTAGPRS